MDAPRRNWPQLIATVLVALAMAAAALGSGNPDTPPEAKMPAWIDTLGNVIAAGIGVAVLIPRTRFFAAIAAIILMVVSMGANYLVDGSAFFLRALPFNLLTIALSAYLASRPRP